MRIPVVLALTVNMIAYFGTRILTTDWHHYDLTCGIDEWVPVAPWTILIYWGSYLYWAANYVIAARQEEQEAYRYFAADFLAKIVCLVTFLVLPTTNVRPQLEGTGLFVDMMNHLYAIDAADNLFPSIHCLTSGFCFLAVKDNPKVHKSYKWFSLLMTTAICISTLTTRQHVIADVAGGLLLAVGSYELAGRTKFGIWYQIWVGKIEGIFRKKN